MIARVYSLRAGGGLKAQFHAKQAREGRPRALGSFSSRIQTPLLLSLSHPALPNSPTHDVSAHAIGPSQCSNVDR
jgi:hypothetical protein